ncbi:MAG: hypothetical protein DWQ34_28150 [Planctomycetota bacterium]|nr:MAG: hypothetical protein DWQ34_28150 [Planctomycetota bacterium]
MKRTSPTDNTRSDNGNDELQQSIESLTQHVSVLTDAVDRLFDELQWRNNERRPRREFTPPTAVLHSMPADPTTDDWKINRVRPQQSSTEQVDEPIQYSRALAQLTSEVADLRQYLAAMILLPEYSGEAELHECYCCLLEWASQEFDPEILRESLPSDIIACVLSEAAEPRQPVDRQQHLFKQGDPDAESNE